MSALLPRFHMVLEKSVSENLSFQEVCTKKDCSNKSTKICPKILVLNNTPILDYKNLFSTLSEKQHFLDLILSRLIFVEKNDGGSLEYLIYFAEKRRFHEKAAEIIKKTACLNPVYSSQKWIFPEFVA